MLSLSKHQAERVETLKAPDPFTFKFYVNYPNPRSINFDRRRAKAVWSGSGSPSTMRA